MSSLREPDISTTYKHAVVPLELRLIRDKHYFAGGPPTHSAMDYISV